MRPKVYIVQRPKIKCINSGSFVDKHDISAARMHGDLVELMPEGNWPKDSATGLALLEDGLKGYTERDSILALGDPVAISAAAMIASRATGGFVCVLKWDRYRQHYVAHDLRLK